MRRAIRSAAFTCGVLCITLSACSHGSSVAVGGPVPHTGPSHTHHPGHGHGPPAHAPAHGYRMKQHAPHGDVELVFDADLGVYVVVGLPSHFFWKGVYLRVENGRWYASASLDGGWKPRSAKSLPPGLRKKTARGKGKKHRGPAKGGW